MIMEWLGPHPLVAATAVCHGAGLVIAAPAGLLRRRGAMRAGVALIVAAFLLNTIAIGQRWIEAGRPPFKTLFETMVFYPWCVAGVALLMAARWRLPVLAPVAAAAALIGLVYGLYRPDAEMVLLPPALQSSWFVPHVVTYFIAYAALFASAALAVLALLARSKVQSPTSKVPDPKPTLDIGHPDIGLPAYAHRAAVLGFCALTLGLFMGGAWGKFAWGDYWSWDPKENWALVTWLAYVAYLHVRRLPGWEGRRAMVVLVGAFAAVVFTYLGMKMLPAAEDSLHVYQ